jgi:uncharacterized protein
MKTTHNKSERMKFILPEAALTQHIIVLGKTRSGKSSKMRVLVEHLLSEGKPVCIVDPKGDWHGLRASADGKRAGYPIVIFGGEHGDVPLNAHAGAAVAELIATGNRPALIDLGGWMVGERTRFFIEFSAAFFKATRGQRFLVIDEVHNFAPQGRVMDVDAGKMLHWANRLASEGAGKGVTLIAASQRPQKVHKDFVTSCETLIACRVVHKLDRDAIKDWIDGCADPAKGRAVLAELAGMDRKEAWVWSPEIDFGPKRITWPLFKTYDSFKPQPADAGKLKGWAEVDLEEVRGKLSSAIKEAEANDPKVLRARIAELERQIAKRAPPAAKTNPAELQQAEARGYDRGRTDGERYRLKDREADHKDLRQAVHRAVDAAMNEGAPLAYVAAVRVEPQPRIVPKPSRATGGNGAGEKLPKAERRILTALAQYPDGSSKVQAAVLTGYAVNGGGFGNALSALRAAGLLEGRGEQLKITPAGLERLGPFEPLPQGRELLTYWLAQLGKAERAALEALCRAYPGELTKEQLAARAGYEANGGGFGNALSRLRTLELIGGRGTLRASPALCD